MQGTRAGRTQPMTPTRHFPRLALFDLDGTLLDSAPDMVATINVMRAARGLPALPLQAIRPHVSRGARAMSAAAFPGLDDTAAGELVPEFLSAYQRELGRHGRPFDGVEAVLAAIEADGARWGIVTNKPEYLARELMPMLGWERRCSILVGGDTLPQRKPHPLPLAHSAQALGVAIHDCVYVGDDVRDIAAARAAGMRSIAALWGYRLADDDPARWGADTLLVTAADMLRPERWPQ